jgi:hypothetical protein
MKCLRECSYGTESRKGSLIRAMPRGTYSPRRVIARPQKIQRLRNGFPHTTSPPLAARQP